LWFWTKLLISDIFSRQATGFTQAAKTISAEQLSSRGKKNFALHVDGPTRWGKSFSQ